MKIDKNFKGLINEVWRYKFEGNIETTEGLEVDLDMGLFVTGFIEAGGSIKAGGSIEAGEFIEAGLFIKAGGSIKAGEFIEAGGSIKAGEFIEAGLFIKAGGSIKAGGFIKAGGSFGIIAGFSITCKGVLRFGLKAFAGVYVRRGVTDEEKTITCGKFEGGEVGYGILKELGLPEKEDTNNEDVLIELDKVVEKFMGEVEELKSKLNKGIGK